MIPERLAIHLARIQLHNCTDLRPCIVVKVYKESDVAAVALSSSDLHSRADFIIDSSHPGFAETGLKRTSFAMADGLVYIPIESLGKARGKLKGELARDFEDWLRNSVGHA